MKLLGQMMPYNRGQSLYRLDQLPYGGGNKIPRLVEFFHRYKAINTLVAMSDEGAHTFNALRVIYKKSSQINQMIFLENQVPQSAYQRKIKTSYMNTPGIRRIKGPTWMMFLIYQYYRHISGAVTLGIGGHVAISAPYFQNMLEDCESHMPPGTKVVHHILPVSSGDMLQQFLGTPVGDYERIYHCIMTGNPLTKPLLKVRFRRHKEVFLTDPRLMTEKEYEAFGRQFYNTTEVSLDPVHSLQTVLKAERITHHPHHHTVLWMTQPKTGYFEDE